MSRHRNFGLPLVLLSAVALVVGCENGPSVSGAFDRKYEVTGPLRLELANASGDVDITGSADGKVHVHGDVRASGFGSESSQKRLDEMLSNPPIEQRGDTIRIGKEMSRMHHVSIAYTIQVPHDTEVSATVASGAQTHSRRARSGEGAGCFGFHSRRKKSSATPSSPPPAGRSPPLILAVRCA